MEEFNEFLDNKKEVYDLVREKYLINLFNEFYYDTAHLSTIDTIKKHKNYKIFMDSSNETIKYLYEYLSNKKHYGYLFLIFDEILGDDRPKFKNDNLTTNQMGELYDEWYLKNKHKYLLRKYE